MTDRDDIRKMALAGHTVLTQFDPFLDTLTGMVAATVRRGFTEDQARAIVAATFGWRPADGSTPGEDGAGE